MLTPRSISPEMRILVIANRTCPCPGLQEAILEMASAEATEVLVVAPALNRRLKHLLSDTDGAVAAAGERLEQLVSGLAAAGVEAHGQVGDARPILAIEDALATFAADQLVISTLPPGRSHWLERGLLERAPRVFDGSITHHVSRYEAEEAGRVEPQEIAA